VNIGEVGLPKPARAIADDLRPAPAGFFAPAARPACPFLYIGHPLDTVSRHFI
jgi:hypothetical protein